MILSCGFRYGYKYNTVKRSGTQFFNVENRNIDSRVTDTSNCFPLYWPADVHEIRKWNVLIPQTLPGCFSVWLLFVPGGSHPLAGHPDLGARVDAGHHPLRPELGLLHLPHGAAHLPLHHPALRHQERKTRSASKYCCLLGANGEQPQCHCSRYLFMSHKMGYIHISKSKCWIV